MKTVAWTAILALIVTIPFLIAKQRPERIPAGPGRATDENRRYDIEDMID